MGRAPSVHNLGPNSREDAPRQVIVIDTESRYRASGTDEVHEIRLWYGINRRRGEHNPSRARRADGYGHDAAGLADWIESQVSSSPPVWVYAHNLSFDLAITWLPVILAERGWSITTHNLASEAPWAVLRKGSKTIRLADSWSILPRSCAEIGIAVGIDKPPLPAQDEDDSLMFERCQADCEIIMEALTVLMGWWEANKLGHWSITGPRTGFNAMRHRCVRRPGYDPMFQQDGPGGGWVQYGTGHVVIDPDPDARMFERKTLYQGRREAFHLGNLPRGMYTELDMKQAHLTVCTNLPLPCRRGMAFESKDVDDRFVDDPGMAIIAEVTIKTDSPRYPVRTRGGIIHPVGTFRTVLAGPEIKEARERGELLAIGKGYHYVLSYHMQPWAKWAERVLAAGDAEHPPVARMAVKGWSRTVPGAWAVRTGRVVMEGTSPIKGWWAEHGLDGATGAGVTVMHMAGRMQMILRDCESDDSFPAVLSFIQSHVRVALNRIIDKLPDGRLITCSTDSVLIDAGGWQPGEARPYRRAELAHAAELDAPGLIDYLKDAAAPFTLVAKRTAADIRVISPQHVRMDGKRKYAGVSAAAEEVERDKFSFLTWPKLGTQMHVAGRGQYVRQRRGVDLSLVMVARWVAECGCTMDPVMSVAGGASRVEPINLASCPHHPGQGWRLSQHPALAAA